MVALLTDTLTSHRFGGDLTTQLLHDEMSGQLPNVDPESSDASCSGRVCPTLGDFHQLRATFVNVVICVRHTSCSAPCVCETHAPGARSQSRRVARAYRVECSKTPASWSDRCASCRDTFDCASSEIVMCGMFYISCITLHNFGPMAVSIFQVQAISGEVAHIVRCQHAGLQRSVLDI